MHQITHKGELHDRRHYVLGVLTLVSFFNYMDRSIISVLVEPIKADLQISDTQVGFLVGFSFAVFYASFGMPLARLADRTSRVRILSLSIVMWSVMTAVSGLTRSYWQLLLARIGVGVGEAGCIPASHSLITDYFPSQERAFAISVFQAGGLAGVTFGLALAGFAAEAWGWRWAFFALGAPGILVGLLAWFTIHEPERQKNSVTHAAEVPDAHIWAGVLGLLRQKSYRHILLAISLGNFVTLGVGQWTAPFFMRVHQLSVSEAGLWLGATSGIGAILGILLGGASSIRLVNRDRRWEVWLPAASAALALPAYLTTFLSTDVRIALMAKFIAAFVASFGSGVGLASIQSVTAPSRRALAVAVIMFASAFIGMGAGPLAVGILSDLLAPSFGRFSIQIAIIAALSVSVWSVFHFVMAGRSFRDDALA
ncbi:MFS transporter [Parasphingorhabdus sp.]|uniref:spinster family MFS transporter n=1 Tax=Parasphingorhabdus sp. TaxID=2709688 RepID=UPI0032ED8C46